MLSPWISVWLTFLFLQIVDIYFSFKNFHDMGDWDVEDYIKFIPGSSIYYEFCVKE